MNLTNCLICLDVLPFPTRISPSAMLRPLSRCLSDKLWCWRQWCNESFLVQMIFLHIYCNIISIGMGISDCQVWLPNKLQKQPEIGTWNLRCLDFGQGTNMEAVLHLNADVTGKVQSEKGFKLLFASWSRFENYITYYCETSACIY